MPTKTNVPDVDAYVARAPEHARPILKKIRDAFHAGCPEVEERIKWGVPSFEYKGMLGGMAAFKNHVSLGFWKSRLMKDPEGLFGGTPRASMMGIRVESASDLPPKEVLVSYVKQAKRLNDEGAKEPRPARTRKATGPTVPAELTAALAKNAEARKNFEALPPSARRDYVEWITEAKREETRVQRVATTVAWLAEGKRRNWKYEKRP